MGDGTDRLREQAELGAMEIWNCVWVGAFAGLAASRLIRGRDRLAPLAGAMAVGVLGALLGAAAVRFAGDLPHGSLVQSALGAGIALIAWAGVQKALFAAPGGEKTSDGR